jgi:hypothetical protein
VLARVAGSARAVSSKSVLASGCARMEETGLAGFQSRVKPRRRLPVAGDGARRSALGEITTARQSLMGSRAMYALRPARARASREAQPSCRAPRWAPNSSLRALPLVVEVDGAQDRHLRRLWCEVLHIEAWVVMQELPRASRARAGSCRSASALKPGPTVLHLTGADAPQHPPASDQRSARSPPARCCSSQYSARDTPSAVRDSALPPTLAVSR